MSTSNSVIKRIAAVLALSIGSAALAEPPVVTLGEPVARITAATIGGYNFGLSMPVALNLEEFRALNIQTLRYPPGNDADDYTITRDMIQALVQPWTLLGRPEMLIVTNFFQGVPHALAVVDFLAEAGIDARMWAIGNEPDLYPRNRMDPTWTVDVYCDRFREVAAALRAVDPDYVITGPAVSGSRPLGLDFLREFVERCGDVVDVVTWHIYPTDGTHEEAAALATSESVDAEIRLVREWLQDPERNPLGYEREIGVAITEFGLSWRTNMLRHLEDMPAALWLADALGRMATEGIDFTHYFALQAMGGHGLIDRTGWIRPTYFVYELLADFSGEALAVHGVPAPLTAYAARSDAGERLLIVNRSSEPVEVALAFGGARLDVATLTDEIFDEILTYRTSELASGEPLVVPARAFVYIRSEP